MNALTRWYTKLGTGVGLFYNQADSQRIVSAGSIDGHIPDLDPVPDYYAIKYGGDWGGMWGNPDLWGKLSPKHCAHKIVPYLYCLPQHYQVYRDMVGGLLNDGYPAVILDIEMEWEGNESTLQSMLNGLNLDANLIGVTGFAWFNGWTDKGKAFGAAIDGLDIAYLPQTYLSDLTGNVPNDTRFIASELGRVLPRQIVRGMVPVLDPLAVKERALQDGSTQAVWHAGDVVRVDWAINYHGTVPVIETPVSTQDLLRLEVQAIGKAIDTAKAAQLAAGYQPADLGYMDAIEQSYLKVKATVGA